MGRKILFITTDQQRYDSLGCNGGAIARTPVVDALARDGVNYRARVQPEHGVHAGALDDAHRSVRAHARRRRERRAAAGDAPSVAAYLRDDGRLPHRAARQGALRARLRPPARSGPRTAWRSDGLDRSVPRLRARRARGARARVRRARAAALRPLADRHARPRGDEGLLAVARGRARRRDRRARDASSTRSRASGTTPTGSPIARSRTSTRCPTTPTGSCGCRSPIRTIRGIRPRAEQHRCNWRDLDLPPGHPGSNEEIERVLAQKPAHWLALWEGTFDQRRGRPGHVPPAERQPTTTSARSTR